MNERRQQRHGTKHGFHPALPVLLAFIGTAVVSGAFGMLIFPIFAQICAIDLLNAVTKVGYAGVVILALSLLMEAYNLYEHHQKHVAWLVVTGGIALIVTAALMHYAPLSVLCA